MKTSHLRSARAVALVVLALLLGSGAAAAAAAAVTSVSAPTTTATGGAPAVLYATTPASPGAIDPAAIPLGDGYISTSPKVGFVDSCITSFPSTGGAAKVGPWVDEKDKTWDSLTKVTVQGSVRWPAARFSVTVKGDRRIISGNDEPIDHTTGVFPIASSDPAYQYDQNPNRVEPQAIDWSLPLHPHAAVEPSCTGGGAIGVLDDGVVLFNALDGEGRDAAAHELLDSCGEHPQMDDVLHHHEVPACILDKAKGRPTLVGYALDGYGIYVERNANGALLTNTQLDACHGRTSRVLWDGTAQVVYHYDATLEYPYTVGCFHGTPITSVVGGGGAATASSGGPPAGGGPEGGGPSGGHVGPSGRPNGHGRDASAGADVVASRLFSGDNCGAGSARSASIQAVARFGRGPNHAGLRSSRASRRS